MVVDPQEEQRIAERAERMANLENRLANLEKGQSRLFTVVFAAAALVGTSVWDAVKAVIFK
jgi:uncharacterized protein (DUF3084 family)